MRHNSELAIGLGSSCRAEQSRAEAVQGRPDSALIWTSFASFYAFQCGALSFILCYYLFKLYCAIKRI